MDQDFIELYVCNDIRILIEERVRELVGVNKRLYTNRLLFITSRLHWKQIHHPQDFLINGARLRTHVSAQQRRINPNSERNTLVWFLSSKGSAITNMINTLVAWNIIKKKKEAQVGVTSRTYVFTDQFADKTANLHRFYRDKDGAFVKKVLLQKREKDLHPVINSVLSMYKHVSLSEAGLNYIQKRYGHYNIVNDIAEAHRGNYFDDNRETLIKACKGLYIDPRHQLLLKFFTKDYYASLGPRNGRLDHNLTNLPKRYRAFVLLNEKPLIGSDIINCQPTLAIGLIKNHLNKTYGKDCQHPDISNYERYCEQGVIYEKIAEKAGIPYITSTQRAKFKKSHFYPEVFYCKNNNWNTPTQRAFKELFPTADMIIRDLKRENYRQFSIDLQKLESDVIVHAVFQQLVTEGHLVITLHDSIYSNDMNTINYAEQLINKKLKELCNIQVSFRSESGPSLKVDDKIAVTQDADNRIIDQNLAYIYFDSKVKQFVDCLKSTEMIRNLPQDTISHYVKSQLHTDTGICKLQRQELAKFFKMFEKEVLIPLIKAA